MSLESFKKEVEGIVGPQNVITDPRELERYSKDMSFVPPRMPAFAVRVRSSEEVVAIIKLANIFKVPLTPFSCGQNCQGAHIPALGGVVLDLSQMKKLEIDELSRNAIVEPGVTFKELAEVAKKYGLRPLYPVTLPADASVLATYLERCPLYSWYRYGSELNLLTMEVVLPDGTLIGTGQWAMFNRKYKQSASPETIAYGISRMFLGAQGTLGVAVKGAVVLKNIHEANEVFFMTFNKLGDVISAFKQVAKVDVGEEVFAMNSIRFAAQFARSPGEVEELARGLPPWIVVVVLRGPKDEVFEVQLPDLKDSIKEIGATLKEHVDGMPESPKLVLEELSLPRGAKKLAEFRGAYNFIPTIAVPSDVLSLDKVVAESASKKIDDSKVARLLMPADWAARALYYEVGYFRDPNNAKETETIKSIFYETSEKLFMAGAFFDRPYGPWAQMVYSRANTYYRVVARVKKLLDPNNIMSPGKLML
jgi:FAD/FMN-containing dehydrogenase